MIRPGSILSVFVASFESPRVSVRWWWRQTEAGELAAPRGRHFLSVSSQKDPFRLIVTSDVVVAREAFEALRDEEESIAPGHVVAS